MASLDDLISRVKIAHYLARHHTIRNDDFELVKTLNVKIDVKTEYKTISILVANVNGVHRNNSKVLDLVQQLCPMFVYVIEPYSHWNPPPDYHAIYSEGFYHNVIWIRNDLRKNMTISRIRFGYKIDNIAFRYIPPATPKEEDMHLEEIEVGDWNFLSNKWIDVNRTIKCEKRNGKPGGTAILSDLPNTTKFVDGDSDHNYMYTVIDAKIKPKKKVDYHKLVTALEDAQRNVVNKDVYKIDRKWKNERKLIVKADSKLVNPVASNLPLDPYYELYNHKESKFVPNWYYPKINSEASRKIQSKAEDVNNFPIRNMITLLSKLEQERKQQVLKMFGWIKFASRTVCLKKKDKIPDRVTNLRPIQISPWSFKIAEQSREKLKTWLDQKTDVRCYAFKKDTKIENIVNWIKSRIEK